MKKFLKGLALSMVFLLAILPLAPIEVFATNGDNGEESPTPKPIKVEPPPGGFADIADFIRNVMKIIFIIAIVLVLFYFVWGGIRWITSGGDKAQTEAARGTLTAAIIGFAIVALAYAIVRLVGQFFGVDIFGEWEIPTPPTPTS